MRIIKYGHIKPDTACCSSCGAVYEFTPADVKKKTIGAVVRHQVDCPVCGHKYNLQNNSPAIQPEKTSDDIDIKNPCFGCCHYDGCGYFDPELDGTDMTDEERFIEHCVGCCCGDGIECNRDNGGCMNYETEPKRG